MEPFYKRYRPEYDEQQKQMIAKLIEGIDSNFERLINGEDYTD